MASERKPQTPRQETDKSLLVEREKTDAEIEKREVIVKGRSDAVVERARERADEVLADARDKADVALERDEVSQAQRRAIETDRAQEDSVLQQERQTADRQLDHERRDRLRALGALLGFERDQTDERLMVERARGDASLLARDNFMSMVAHDVRSLLGGIAMGAALQIENAGDDEKGQRVLKTSQKIQRLTARINRLIGDLFDVTSIESGRFSVTPSEQDVGALIAEAVDAFGPLASIKELSLETLVEPTEPLRAQLDHDRIFQVLANLLSNAIKFTPEGGRLSLRARSEGAQVVISVSDSGPGIAADQLEMIFERFWQVRKDDRRGLGLGLFISKCIVEAHGGRLWAESVPGKGSTFHFTLPASA